MRKSDDQAISKKAEVEHFQKKYLLDKILLVLVLVSGFSRAIYALFLLFFGNGDFSGFRYEFSDLDRIRNTFLYDYNWSPTMNFVFACSILIAVWLLKKKMNWGYRMYVGMHLFMILIPIFNLSESQMLFHSYYWVLSGVWLIILSWRKGYIL